MTPMSNSMQKVEEANYGVYVWNVKGRGLLVNEDGDFLRINSMRGDISKMAELSKAAAYWGFPDGEPVFLSGRRAVSQDEYDEQMARHQSGLVADPYDLPALIDQQKRAASGE